MIDANIHGRLNIAVAAAVYCAAIFLLWAASRVSLVWVVPIGFVFSFNLLTNYALMHESAHDNLHQDPRWNYFLGVLASFLFPASFSLIKVVHTVHHCCNRTDHEMFDQYYPEDNMFLKLGQWYGLLSGLMWPMIPIGMVILVTFPGLLRTTPFRKARTTAVLFDDFERNGINQVRIEVAVLLIFWIGLFSLLDLRWENSLILYACFAFNWSTRQYVTHAFTPRDVINGALNLHVSKPMSWLLLKGNWDLVHHQKPWLPWTALEAEGQHSTRPSSYWKQYFRMWLGPVPAQEPGPQRLADTPAASGR